MYIMAFSHDINQKDLEEKLKLFFNQLGDESLSQFLNGLCNAHAFRQFENFVFDLKDKNLERMQKIIATDDKVIIERAISYQEYKKARHKPFTEAKWQSIREAEDLYFYGHHLAAVFNPSYLKRFTHLLLLKEAPTQLAHSTLGLVLGDGQLTVFYPVGGNLLKKIIPKEDFSEDFKADDEVLIGKITRHLDVSERLNQEDYIEMLDILKLHPPEGDNKTKQVFQIAFNFTKEELIHLFNNEYGNVIYVGDIIVLGSTTHRLLLKKTEQGFELFDPGRIKLADNSAKTLVEALEKCFFSDYGVSYDTMPLSLTIFTKMGGERSNRISIIKQILAERTAKKVDIDERAWDGATSVWMAAQCGHTDTLQVLFKAKADVTMAKYDGVTPLMIAALNGHINVIKAFIKAKKNLNKKDEDNWTAAMYAAQEGQANVIKVLAEAKADFAIKNKKGNTADIIAIQHGYADIADLIRKIKTPSSFLFQRYYPKDESKSVDDVSVHKSIR